MKNIGIRNDRPSKYIVRFSVDGKEHKKSFSSLPAAKDYARQYRRRRAETGLDAMFFLPEERADYKRVLELAKSNGYKTAWEFADALIRAKGSGTGEAPPPPAGVPTPNEAFDEYIELKQAQGRAKSTIHSAKVHVGGFCKAFESVPLNRITQANIEDYVLAGKELAPRTRKNRFVEILVFLRFCKRRGYTSLPLDLNSKALLPRELKKAKPVFSLAEVRSFLDKLQDSPRLRKFIPFYALQLFCGIRRAEAERMRWEYIDIEKQEIRLPAEITKTGDEHVMRAPFLPKTVFAWLAPFEPKNMATEIPHPTQYESELVQQAAGVWQHNGCRHTFATMHVSLHGEPAKTAILLRHRNQERLWTNYLATLRPEAEAREYFALVPRRGIKNEVAQFLVSKEFPNSRSLTICSKVSI